MHQNILWYVCIAQTIFLVILYSVGQKGDTGENSIAEIANVEETATNIQGNITEIFGKANCFLPAQIRRVLLYKT